MSLMRSGVGAFCMGSRLARRFFELLFFFVLAGLEDDDALEEAEPELLCCGRRVAVLDGWLRPCAAGAAADLRLPGTECVAGGWCLAVRAAVARLGLGR
jgi:hypothetical protein